MTACGHSAFDDLPSIQAVTSDGGPSGNEAGSLIGDGSADVDAEGGAVLDAGLDATPDGGNPCTGIANCKAVFVSAAIGNDDNPGTATKPVKTIAKGIDLANGARFSNVLIGGGTYPEDVVVVEGVSLHGSFKCDVGACTWETQNVQSSPTIITNQHSAGFTVNKDVTRATTLSHLVVESKDGTVDDTATFGNVAIEITGGATILGCTFNAHTAQSSDPVTQRSIGVLVDGNPDKAPLLEGCTITSGIATTSIGVLLQTSPTNASNQPTNAVIQSSTIISGVGGWSYGVQATTTSGTSTVLLHDVITAGVATNSTFGSSWGVLALSPLLIDGNQINAATPSGTPSGCAVNNTANFCGGVMYAAATGGIVNNWIRGVPAQKAAALELRAPEDNGGGGSTGIIVNSNTLDGAGYGQSGVVSTAIVLHNSGPNAVVTLGSVRNNILIAGINKTQIDVLEDPTPGKAAHCHALEANDFVPPTQADTANNILYRLWDPTANGGNGASTDENTLSELNTLTTPIPDKNISSDPGLVNGYQITSASPCANVAVTTEEPTTDITGKTTRPQGAGPDIGCWETN